MPITILCPGCKTRLTLDDYRAGTTFGCPKCATAINVPIVVESPPTPLPPPPAPPVPRPLPPAPPPTVFDLEPEEEEEEEEDEEVDSLAARYRRRRSRRARNRLLMLVSVVTLLGVACVVLVPKAIQRVRDSSRASASAMNPTERKLVGVWVSDGPGGFLEIEFRRDGTFRWHCDAAALDIGPQDVSGTWSAAGKTLTFKFDKVSGPNDARLDGTWTNTIEIVSIDESQLALRLSPKLSFPPLTRKSLVR